MDGNTGQSSVKTPSKNEFLMQLSNQFLNYLATMKEKHGCGNTQMLDSFRSFNKIVGLVTQMEQLYLRDAQTAINHFIKSSEFDLALFTTDEMRKIKQYTDAIFSFVRVEILLRL